MRKVARLVPGAKSVIERAARRDYSKPGKPDIDWDDADAKQNLVSDLVTDALAVLGGVGARTRRTGRSPRRTRWGCWRWWRGRMWSPPTAPMAPTGGGESRGGWRRIG